MITINIGWAILIGIILVCIGFFISAFVSGSKMQEFDLENKKLVTENNRKDMKIRLYELVKNDNESNNSKVTDIIKERKSK